VAVRKHIEEAVHKFLGYLHEQEKTQSHQKIERGTACPFAAPKMELIPAIFELLNGIPALAGYNPQPGGIICDQLGPPAIRGIHGDFYRFHIFHPVRSDDARSVHG